LWGEVGTWVLEEATRQAQPWAARGLWLAVNISPQQVEAGYAQGVLSSLAATGFPPDFLCLELTGTAGLSDAALAWAELRAVKTQGVRLLIDDFGTAGSSIADLVQFRLDGVKIAPTFVAGLGSEAEAEAIVSALVGLAHALDMQTIAEGVETEAQLARLRALGCDLAQGYLFQHPGDAATIAAGHLAGLALGRGAVRNP
ncbi:MAG: EAL domain-containing protein, partial [Acidimicrobiia bacterium]